MYRTSRRIGYVGKRKKAAIREFNEKYGKGNWRIAWQWEDKTIEREEALSHYEDAYLYFFESNPEELEWLINTASDIYDISPNDVNSGLDYSKNQRGATHIQDITIRRVVNRLGKNFDGNRLLQVRRGGEAERYNPGIVKFHKPEMIIQPRIRGWWKPNTIEDFWQSNKILQVKNKKRRIKY
ncbi:MAG: hypothetical protein ABIH25_05745 [Candidatus Woesearchaeota archaeon]